MYCRIRVIVNREERWLLVWSLGHFKINKKNLVEKKPYLDAYYLDKLNKQTGTERCDDRKKTDELGNVWNG